MNSKVMFRKNQISPKKRKTSLAPPQSDLVIFELGSTADSKQGNDGDEGKISVAFEAGRGRNLYVGAIQKPVGGCKLSPAAAGGSDQRPVDFGGVSAGGPVGLQYLSRSISPVIFYQKPLSAVTIHKPYFSVSHTCFLCCKKFQPGDDIFMFQDEYAFCSLDCRELQMDFFEKRDMLICQRAAATSCINGQSCNFQ